MMLELSIETPGAPEDLRNLLMRVATACAALEAVEKPQAFCRIVDDKAIRSINRQTRGIDRATDVLSFPTVEYTKGTARDNPRLLKREYDIATGHVHLGDFVISLPRARAQAAEYGHSLNRELAYLTAHAMFHLMGYDHEKSEDKRAMRAMEEQAMAALGIVRETSMEIDREKLIALATEAMQNAYVPYSNYPVGACVLMENGEAFTGCNIENASYGLTICAERVAIGAAVKCGLRRIAAIAVVGKKSPAWPCGACRQVINEFADGDTEVIVAQENEPCVIEKLSNLLPHAFGPDSL